MIDIEKAKNEFEKYTSNFDNNDFKISLKVKHSYRTAEYAKTIAKEAGKDEKLGELIGLLHDIGRFEQIKRYGTFDDRKSIDHANLGVEILKNDNYIDRYCDDKKIQNIILQSIQNHNKIKIEDGIEGDNLIYCKIIRDADKVDILDYTKHEDEKKLFDEQGLLTSRLNDKFLNNYKKCILMSREDIKSPIDSFVCEIEFVFDVNYNKALKIIWDNNSINNMFDMVKNSVEIEKLNEFKGFVLDYMKKRIEV